MIRHKFLVPGVQTSHMWIYLHDSDDPMPDYQGVMTLQWPWPGVVRASGFKADPLPRSILRQIVRKFDELGVSIVQAERAPGRLLPLGKQVGDHWEMDVKEAMKYAGK